METKRGRQRGRGGRVVLQSPQCPNRAPRTAPPELPLLGVGKEVGEGDGQRWEMGRGQKITGSRWDLATAAGT